MKSEYKKAPGECPSFPWLYARVGYSYIVLATGATSGVVIESGDPDECPLGYSSHSWPPFSDVSVWRPLGPGESVTLSNY